MSRAARLARTLAALAAALALPLAGASPALAQAQCSTPQTYLQFCCFGCLVWDWRNFAQNNAQSIAAAKNAFALLQKLTLTEQQLSNDAGILERMGSSTPTVAELMHVFQYGQGLSFGGSQSAAGTIASYEALYDRDQSSASLGAAPAGGFQSMMADMIYSQATSSSYASQALAYGATNQADLKSMAQAVADSTTKRMDIKTNSRIREKVAELEMAGTMLIGQYIALKARPIAYLNQTDLTRPAP